MSWLYSQALVEAFLEDASLDGERFAPSNTTHTPRAFCSPDKMMDFSRLSRFGMTFGHLTAEAGEDVLTWFQAGFPVRIYPQQEKAPASPESEADSGWKWRGSSVKYDPDTCLWKTRQYSLLGGSEWFSETWPKWGILRDGECWELPMSARPIYERGSGLLPTPTKMDAHLFAMMPKNGDTTRMDKYGKLRKVLRDGRTASMGLTRILISRTGRFPKVELFEELMGWPSGWSELKDAETAKSRNVPPKHGGC